MLLLFIATFSDWIQSKIIKYMTSGFYGARDLTWVKKKKKEFVPSPRIDVSIEYSELIATPGANQVTGWT